MKRLSMIMVCLLGMMSASLSAKAQEVTITLKPGWTWIGYPSTDTVDFATALGTFTPREGDMIACEYDFSEYFDGGWFGDIQHFYPGYGYMYYSTRAMPVMLTFNMQPPTPQLTVTTAEPTEITAISAVSGGSITSNDGSYVFVLEKGICWATHPNPMVMNDFFTENGNGAESFTAEMTDLSPNTVYYVRAYAVTLDGTYYGDDFNFTTHDGGGNNVPEGAINGLFSINANGDQVYFSQGNLQYQPSTNTWRFANNQYDILITSEDMTSYWDMGINGGYYYADVSSQYTSSYNGWIDLFGWGTSGFNHGATCYTPWSTRSWYGYYYAYGCGTCDLFDQNGQADWGYNAISNGGDLENYGWRTLTEMEWSYLLYERNTLSGISFAKAQVNEINGIILLPDNWNTTVFSLNNTNNGNSSFTSNILTLLQWSVFESAGAVFLPASGRRDFDRVSGASWSGFYWSTSCNGFIETAYNKCIDNNGISSRQDYKYCGCSVRLVRNTE